MPSKSKKKPLTLGDPLVTVDKNMRDYSNDPYFKKKKADAKAFLKAHPLPDWITNRTKK